MSESVAAFVGTRIFRFLFSLYMSLTDLSLKDLYSPISHLVQTVIKYCKFISVSGRRLNNRDTSIIGLITYICLLSLELTITKLVSKCVRGINEQLLKTSGADVFQSRKKTQKNLRGRWQPLPLPQHPPPPPCMSEGLKKCICLFATR